MPYESALTFGFVILVLASGWAFLKAWQQISKAARDRNVPMMDAFGYIIIFGLFVFFAYFLMTMLPFIP